ncbi:lipase member H-like [Gadus chalcogrammus]|uniref:lipase member H-like n=1 Tax=Gadus chalcogrammus TaxID=1042646 RepID=UPI0024C2CFEF|nr:lipase member H-like [Gadus chalcogrammus]
MYAPTCLLYALVISMWVDKAPGQACDTFTDLDLHHAIVGTEVNVRLLLYSRADPECGRLLLHSAAPPAMNLSLPTTFIIHGFRPTGSPPVWLLPMAELVLEREDRNVVVVDWNYGAANIDYFRSVRNSKDTATNLTAFIRTMQEHGASLDSIHMIGISLGAHISGFVGADLNGSIGRITGLDAAGPMFAGKLPEYRLDRTDAQFVDVIHTDIDALGLREPLGHIDFYPNGGADQLGCPKTILKGVAYFKCDHQRSTFLFMESLNKTCEIRAFPCTTYDDFLDARCTDCTQFGAQGCPIFGYDVVKWKDTLLRLGQTKSFFNTNGAKPYCKTNYRFDVITWNQEVQWGYITIKLYGKNQSAKATIDHKRLKFEKYTETQLLAQFDGVVETVEKMSVTYSSAIVLGPKHKLRVLQLRLQRIEGSTSLSRSLCRYDLLLKEKEEVTFRPIPCVDSNF